MIPSMRIGPAIIILAGMLQVSPVSGETPEPPLVVAGTTVIPHVQSSEMRYRKPTDRSLGARVQLFLVNQSDTPYRITPDMSIRVRGKAPADWLKADEWAWHDFPSAWPESTWKLPSKAMTVWSFNGKRAPWGVGKEAPLEVGGVMQALNLDKPRNWLSSVSFLGPSATPYPDSMIFHVVNQTDQPLRLQACRLWLPDGHESWRILRPQSWLTNLMRFPRDGIIAGKDRGGARVQTGPLPLSYAAVQVRLLDPEKKTIDLWAHLRIKREVFDIGGGWVASRLGTSNTLHAVPYLKTLRRMHVNSGMHDHVAGYTDNSKLYQAYPLKYMNRCQPVERYDNKDTLPRIHAVEFLGEPQYGGGKPVPPMKVWQAFAPYQRTRLPTSVTHSEERIWRFYAGLSDYPHYDAYRVCAPAADSWSAYDRWAGTRVRWGAPLETIGTLTRSLRELNRPTAIAYWSQGAHAGWSSFRRPRSSPTPLELRMQAYHGVSSRITSLYWFNLSLKSLLKFPDLIDPITRVGREIRLLEDYYLEGDAYHFERRLREGRPDWDLAVIAGPRGAVLFALDLDYSPDPERKVFQFKPPRDSSLSWPLPAYLSKANTLFRVQADGITEVPHQRQSRRLSLQGNCGPVNVFVLTGDKKAGDRLEARRLELIAYEQSFQFDPENKQADLDLLRSLATGLK